MNIKTKTKFFTASYKRAFLIEILVWSSYNLVNTVIPLILSSELDANASEIGLVLGLSSISTFIARPFVGYIIDNYGRQKTIIFAQLLMAFLYFGFLLSKTLLSFGVLRFLLGIPYAASTTAIITYATDILPKDQRGQGLSLFTVANSLGIALGPSVGLALYYAGYKSQIFLLVGILGICCILLASHLEMPYVELSKKKIEKKSLIETRVGFMAITEFLFFLSIPSVMSFGAIYAQSAGIEKGSMVFSMYGIGLVFTRLVSGKTIDKKGPRFSGLMAISLLFLGLISIGTIRNTYGFLIGGIFFGAGAGIITPTLITMAVEVVPFNRRGMSNALIYIGIDLGNSIGAYIFGTVSDILSNYNSTYLLLSCVEVVNILFFLLIAIPYFQKEKTLNSQ